MKWYKHEKYFPELIKYWINNYKDDVQWYAKAVPNEFKDFPIKQVKYNPDELTTYEIIFEGIDNKWRFFLRIVDVFYNQTTASYVATIQMFSIYEPTVDKYSYSDVDEKLKFVMQLAYKLNENNIPVNINHLSESHLGYYSNLYEILQFIDEDPWCAIWFTLHYSSYYNFKNAKQMRKEAKKEIRKNEKSQALKDKYNLENIQYTKKLLEEDWNKDQEENSDEFTECSFEIYDEGSNCSPRYEVYQLCDDLVHYIQEDNEGEDIRDVYTLELPEEIQNKLEKRFNKQEKRNIWSDSFWHYSVCTKEWYENFVKERQKFEYEITNEYKVLDI